MQIRQNFFDRNVLISGAAEITEISEISEMEFQNFNPCIGRPFGADADDGEDGVVDAIVRLCSFDHLSGLEVSKRGKTNLMLGQAANRDFFRRGGVGDWANHMSPAMAQRIDAITEAKFKGSGLSV